MCYTTLKCNFGALCLNWRDICDREQQCNEVCDEENFALISNMLFVWFSNPDILTKLCMEIYKCEKTIKKAC